MRLPWPRRSKELPRDTRTQATPARDGEPRRYVHGGERFDDLGLDELSTDEVEPDKSQTGSGSDDAPGRGDGDG